jgi:hypothetical protein
MSKQMIVWGVMCRACSAPIAFGSPSHHRFELESTFAKPGAIRCANGHNYIYFPRDFKFFVSAESIPEATMQKNREAHSAINPPVVTPTDQLYGTRWVPARAQATNSPDAKALPEKSGPGPRRETEPPARSDWWPNWADEKVS